MSLFASLGQGDIWALSGISFASPINDLLEKGEFTLENLLEEDELIQEVKAKNEQLIEFLSREGTIDHLLDFVITPVDPTENELRVFKYPYMSCEVICCEVPEILNALVENKNGAYLDKLFTFLAMPKKLDHYLAGYFEKILEMLFRRMTVPMMKYFNDAGTSLLTKFLDHMDNYSIMQIVQRLMLPHIPFANVSDSEADLSEEERMLRQCNWSFSAESCQLLFDRMLDQKDAEVPLHISDLLITVLQLSPPETLVISYLCEPACVQRLVRAIVGEGIGAEAGEGEACALDIASPGDSYSCAASVSLAAISVLESLNSRLFEASLPFDQSMSQGIEGGQEHLTVVREQVDAVCLQLLPYIPRIQGILQQYLTRNPCKPFVNQGKTEVSRLGHRGLQLVKLVESIVRMGSPAVDDSFCQCGLFRTCLDLLFHFDSNSFLHLSVQRIVITVLESDRARSATQRHLLTECGLLESLMARIEQYSTAPSSAAAAESRKDAASAGEGAAGTGSRAAAASMTPKHSSVMGNLLLIAQALSVALDADGGAGQGDGHGEGGNDTSRLSATGNSFLTDSSLDSGEAHNSANQNSEHTDGAQAGVDKPGSLRAVVLQPADAAAGPDTQLDQWDDFVQRTLHSILDHQIVGSYSAIANLSCASQDDPTKLGVDLDMFPGAGGGGAYPGGLHSEMGAQVWQRNHYGEEEEDDEDDDFMFQGPGATSRDYDAANADGPAAFQANFDFSRRQDFTATGFDLGADPHAAAGAAGSFADFAAFGEEPATGSTDFAQGQAAFADFASFDNFGSLSTDGEDTSKFPQDDFAPSEF